MQDLAFFPRFFRANDAILILSAPGLHCLLAHDCVRPRPDSPTLRGAPLSGVNTPREASPRYQGERMTAALLDRLTHRCHIFEMNGESYRFRESMKTKKTKAAK